MRTRTRLVTATTAALVAGGITLGGATAANAATTTPQPAPTAASASSAYGTATVSGVVHEDGRTYLVGHVEGAGGVLVGTSRFGGFIASADQDGDWKADLTTAGVTPGTVLEIRTHFRAPAVSYLFAG